MTIFGLAESFKTMNRPDMTRPGATVTLFDGLFLGEYESQGCKILTQFSFMAPICFFSS